VILAWARAARACSVPATKSVAPAAHVMVAPGAISTSAPRGDGHGPGQDEPILPDVGAADLTHRGVGGVTSGRIAAGRRARRESSQRDLEEYMTKHERPASKRVAIEPGPHASRFAAAARRHVHPR